MRQKREDVRNVAIIAHVDHGKTTQVDELFPPSCVFCEIQEVAELVMVSIDIERVRGITILSKNTAVMYKGTKINIIDTPGHADFGGEVERVLKMVNGVILVVDAFEGAMPQTKFVLRKALELKLPVIVCINKIDRPEARPDEVVDEVLELFLELDADDSQLDCPFVYASAKAGIASLDADEMGTDMEPLFETILNYIPAPEGDPDAATQVLISTIDYNDFVGRIGGGKVDNGTIRVNQDVVICNHHDPDKIIIHYKDAATAFNNVKKATIENKGVLNNAISTLIFKELQRAGVKTHYIETINDRDQICRKVTIIPLEVIVRNVIAGSMAQRLGIEEGTKPSNVIFDICYKNDELGDPLINDHHAVALGVVTYDELKQIYAMTARINEVLKELFAKMNINLIDFKIEFGRTSDGEIVLADEVSPDTCRLWDMSTNEKLDKDRFRRDLGKVREAYEEILARLEKVIK